MRSLRLPLCLTVATIAAAGCGLLTTSAASGVSPGLLVAGEDTATITAPDTVDHGVNFTVTSRQSPGATVKAVDPRTWKSDPEMVIPVTDNGHVAFSLQTWSVLR